MAAQGWTPVPDTSAWKPVEEKKGFASSFADASGLTAISPTHIIDTIIGLPSALKAQAKSTVENVQKGMKDTGLESRRDFVRAVPILGPAVEQAQQQYDTGDIGGMAGTLAGTVAGFAGPEAMKAVAPKAVMAVKAAPAAAETAVRTVGEAVEARGNRLINETVGSYRKDFNRGANPGRGYNEAIGGPTISMRSLANKADSVKNATGDAIGKVINKSGQSGKLIPVQEVYEAVSKPIRDQFDAEMGEGGMGNTEAFAKYAENFKPILQKAVDKGGLTAQEVFDLKRRIAKRTKWSNTTPEGIMDVRQNQVGALGGLLTKEIPELSELNRNYQDLVGLADRAAWRSESGAKTFSSLVREGAKATGAVGAGMMHNPAALGVAAGAYALDTVPGRTAIATGLFRGGKGLQSIADRIEAFRGKPVPAAAEAIVGDPIGDQTVIPQSQPIRITRIKKVVQ